MHDVNGGSVEAALEARDGSRVGAGELEGRRLLLRLVLRATGVIWAALGAQRNDRMAASWSYTGGKIVRAGVLGLVAEAVVIGVGLDRGPRWSIWKLGLEAP